MSLRLMGEDYLRKSKSNNTNYASQKASGYKRRRFLIRTLQLAGIALLALIIFFLIPAPQQPALKLGPSWQFLARDGTLLRELLGDQDHLSEWVPLNQISPHLIHAALASEDKYFYLHPGVNPLAICRALIQNLKARRIVSGGSTITQQLARSYWPRKSLLGKINEIRLALWLEHRMSKDQILEAYLNRLSFGNLCYGISSASRIYFDKSPQNLSPAESAFLMVIPRAPTVYNPYHRLPLIKIKRDRILDRMYQLGFLDELSLSRAKTEPISLQKFALNFRAPHLVNYLVERGVRPGPDGKIWTTIDYSLQQEVEKIISAQLKQLQSHQVENAAAIVIDNQTREVLAYVGSADFFNQANDGQIDGVRSLRQPGSAIKPFTYLAALLERISPGTILPDLPVYLKTRTGTYAPRNYDNIFHGPVLMRQALASSLNVPAVRLADQIGPEKILRLLRDFGLSSLNKPADHYGLGLTLGNGEVTLLELARAYVALANLGIYSDLVFVRGEKPLRQRVADSSAVFILSDFLTDDVARSMEFGRHGVLKLPFPSAVKTGTTRNFRDNWCLGYTREVTVAVWVGNFSGAPMRNISGITGAGPIWREIMLSAMKNRTPKWYEAPANLVRARICPVSGKLLSKDCPGGMEEWFFLGQEPKEFCDAHLRLRIDQRNQLLAGPDCPKQFVTEKVFLNLATEYQPFAGRFGMALKPEGYSPLCLKSPPESPATNYYLKISYPRPGSVFALDPGIPLQYQALLIQAHTNLDPTKLLWYVNGKPEQQGSSRLKLPLARGKFLVKVKAELTEQELADESTFIVK